MSGNDGYLKARPQLRRDFAQRCAYCMIHEQEGNGPEAFEVDHFHPCSRGGAPNDYANLYWSCAPCNRLKGDQWPTPAHLQRGYRFADPCCEQDYGVHIVEGADGELVARTTCGEYHIAALRLNRPRLRRLRTQRSERQARLAEAVRLVDELGNDPSLREEDHRLLAFVHGELQALQADLDVAIPLIPPAQRLTPPVVPGVPTPAPAQRHRPA